jgi:phosphosulfolactate phosphohydrolase-like enzyme
VLAGTAQEIVEDHHRDDRYPKQVNMTHALCAMKDAVVRLLTCANPVVLLRRLIEVFANTVEPVRPRRFSPRRKGPRLHGYYTAYKPCSGSASRGYESPLISKQPWDAVPLI